jgi:hypothetical protein
MSLDVDLGAKCDGGGRSTTDASVKSGARPDPESGELSTRQLRADSSDTEDH